MKLSTANLQTRTRRATLPCRRAPYWVGIGERGRCIGYRRTLETATGTWHARLFMEGSWIQTKLGLTDDGGDADGTRVLTLLQAKEKALLWFPAARNEAEGNAQGNGNVQRRGKCSVSDALADYFEECRREMKAGNVYRQQCSSNAHILPALGHLPVETLTIGRIKKWMGDLAELPARKRTQKGSATAYRESPSTEDDRRARRDTINRVLTILKAALNLAVKDRRVPVTNAFAWREVKSFASTGKARTLFLTPAQQRIFIKACEEDFSILARAGLYCGARYGELNQAFVSDYSRANGSLYVAPHVAKNGKARHVHLDQEAKNFFDEICAGRAGDTPLFLRANREDLPSSEPTHRRWRSSEQARSMREACVKAGLAPFPFYTLRHTCASRWLKAGAPMAYVAAQLGNSVAICEKYYGHLSSDHVAQIMRAMPPLGLVTGDRRQAADNKPNLVGR